MIFFFPQGIAHQLSIHIHSSAQFTVAKNHLKIFRLPHKFLYYRPLKISWDSICEFGIFPVFLCMAGWGGINNDTIFLSNMPPRPTTATDIIFPQNKVFWRGGIINIKIPSPIAFAYQRCGKEHFIILTRRGAGILLFSLMICIGLWVNGKRFAEEQI